MLIRCLCFTNHEGRCDLCECWPICVAPVSRLCRFLLVICSQISLLNIWRAPSVLVDLWFPASLDLRFPFGGLGSFSHLHLDTLPRPEDLALQIKTSPFIWIVLTEELLEAQHHTLHIRLATLRWSDVEDLAGLIERKTGGGKVVSHARAIGGSSLSSILLRCGGLLVSFGKGTTQYSGACNDHLGYDAMRLRCLSN